MKVLQSAGVAMVCLLMLMTGCNESEPYTYTGKHIELDFSSAEKIGDEDWVEIGGIRFTHYKDFLLAHQDDYSLPASESIYLDMEGPVDPHSIAVTLGTHLKSVQLTMDGENSRIIVEPELLLFGRSRLQLKREDGSEFTIRTSPGYNVPITILE